MDDRTITISISDESEVFGVGIAALERETKLHELRRLIAEGDSDIAAGRVHAFNNSAQMKRAVIEWARLRS